MNPITKLTIENFQSHQKSVIYLATNGQLTVITGPSDSGKTVILRALRWLLYNEPQGTDFIRVGASFARVTAEFESGHAVIRERTKATNRYKIIAPGTSEPQVFEGFGTSVPVEVQEITGVRPVQIGDLTLNLNLAEQLAGPFLGSSISAGARAKVLGKLAGTEEIDYAAKQLGTDLFRRSQDEKRLTAEIADLEAKIQEYNWLPATKAKIEALEELVTRIKAGHDRKNRLSQLKEQLTVVDGKIIGCRGLLHKWRNLNEVVRLAETVKSGQEKRTKLMQLKAELSKIDTGITLAQAALYRWRHLKQAEQLSVNAADNHGRLELMAKLANDYWACQTQIIDYEAIIRRYAILPEVEFKFQAAQAAEERAKRLHNLKVSYITTQKMVQENQEILNRLQGVDEAGNLAASIQAKTARRDALRKLVQSYTETDCRIDQEQARIEALQQVTEAEKLLQTSDEKRQRRERLVGLRDKHSKLSCLVESMREQVVVMENRIAELEGAYLDELTAAGICPLCGQPITIENFKEAV